MKILVPLDGSRAAEQALPTAANLAKAPGTTVVLLSIVRPNDAAGTWRQGSPEDEDLELRGVQSMTGPQTVGFEGTNAPALEIEAKGQAEEVLRDDAEDYLSGIAQKYFSNGVPVTVKLGRDETAKLMRRAEADYPEKHFPNGVRVIVKLADDVPTEIISTAAAEHPDLIVMATHGRTGLARVSMGSVTDAVVRSRVAPMVITRPDNLNGPES